MVDIVKIYNEIKKKIINFDLVPDTQIKEEDLAEAYNVSRTPIRYVIARLVQDGLLVVEPKKGTYVSKINVKDIDTDRYIRKAVEVSAICKAAEVISPEQIKHLEEILNEQNKIIQLEPSILKSQLLFKNDNIFHQFIFKIANIENVWEAIDNSTVNLNRARIMANLRTNTSVEKIYDQHNSIVEHLKNNDVKNAILVFNDHLDSGFDGIEDVMNKYPNYFKQ